MQTGGLLLFSMKATGDDGASLGQGFDQVDVVELRNRSRSWNAHYFVGVGEKDEETMPPPFLASVAEAKPFGIHMVQPRPAFGVDAIGFMPVVITVNNGIGVDAVVAHTPA